MKSYFGKIFFKFRVWLEGHQVVLKSLFSVNHIQGKNLQDEKECIPVAAREGSPENHFYDDKSKFHVCLPTKTGSTNWLKMLLSLFLYNGDKDPEKISANDIYAITQMPRYSRELEEFAKGRSGKGMNS